MHSAYAKLGRFLSFKLTKYNSTIDIYLKLGFASNEIIFGINPVYNIALRYYESNNIFLRSPKAN